MTNDRDYDHLAERLAGSGRDVAAVERALGALVIETPSWGYGDTGTRFAVYQQPGRPRDVFERLDDAAEVNRLTGAASAVALHFPWMSPGRCAATRRSSGCASARRTPTSFRTPPTSSAP